MIKKIAWNAFKNTGNIDTFLELKQIQDIEEKIQEQNLKIEQNINYKDNETINPTLNYDFKQKVEQNGNDKIKWNNNF